jgi:hypothetical protein
VELRDGGPGVDGQSATRIAAYSVEERDGRASEAALDHDGELAGAHRSQAILGSENSETTVPLSDTACLLMRPMPMGCRLTVREASAHEVETINLRTYGWADEYVFGRTQQTLVAVRTAARRRPADVIRPTPFTQVAILEPDPDDNTLADANRRRGWPPQLPNERGELRDYIVIPTDRPHPELLALADELTERRARKGAGVGAGESFKGRIINNPLHPLDLMCTG